MFKHAGKHQVDEQALLSQLYDFVLEVSITDRERKIGLMAKADLERNRYSIAVLNKLVVSFQMEALRNKGLSPAASKFYDQMYSILIAAKPIGTNLGYIGLHSTYLD
ncbi:bacteriocin immunity protein [Lactiplantibacillus sp. DA1]|uniref:bacteriocin immunity protein n=1 Tax=Lactiplantibacillus sp. DA1 TaxID=3079857 RepID=UPI00292A5EF8|nr:bacteriocin immunity protein [Lactiplantibacillus sp. DA1]MDV0430932.1 bacteriocin immunity protein [Lactiplantibacillus sp. DA1]